MKKSDSNKDISIKINNNPNVTNKNNKKGKSLLLFFFVYMIFLLPTIIALIKEFIVMFNHNWSMVRLG